VGEIHKKSNILRKKNWEKCIFVKDSRLDSAWWSKHRWSRLSKSKVAKSYTSSWVNISFIKGL